MVGCQKAGRQWMIAILCIATVLVIWAGEAAAVAVTVTPTDGAGEGFNDGGAPEANSTAAGNSAATLGAQRLASFQAAANVWGMALNSAITILVNAAMDSQGDCAGGMFSLGSAGATAFFQNLVGLPPNIFHPVALANKLSNTDQTGVDMTATFNSDLDSAANCAGARWFYPVDNRAAPSGFISFYTTALHELGHGLCFASLLNQDGTFGAPSIDIYSTFLESHLDANTFDNLTATQRSAATVGDPNLHWTGPNVLANLATAGLIGGVSNGHPQMFGPNPFQSGSSIVHWDEDFITTGGVHEFMEPIADLVSTDLLSRFLCQDIGWGAVNNQLPVELQTFSIE